MGFIKGLGQFMLFLGILGLALVSVSSPLVPSIYFLKGQFANSINLLLGLSGGCVHVGESQTCPGAKLGYSISLDNFPGKTSIGSAPLNPTLTYALILIPIAAILSLLSFLISLPKRNRFAHTMAVWMLFLTFLVSGAGLICALLVFVRALNRINDQFAPASPASLGPAIWILIAAVICVAFAGLLIAGSGAPKRPASDTSSQRSLTNEKYGQGAYTQSPYRYSQENIHRPAISEPYLQQQGMNTQYEPANEGYYYPSAGRPSQDDGEHEMRTRKLSRSGRSIASRSSLSNRY